jgi:hypothetical protein
MSNITGTQPPSSPPPPAAPAVHDLVSQLQGRNRNERASKREGRLSLQLNGVRNAPLLGFLLIAIVIVAVILLLGSGS